MTEYVNIVLEKIHIEIGSDLLVYLFSESEERCELISRCVSFDLCHNSIFCGAGKILENRMVGKVDMLQFL
jgi:hypothetical protein